MAGSKAKKGGGRNRVNICRPHGGVNAAQIKGGAGHGVSQKLAILLPSGDEMDVDRGLAGAGRMR